jgi:hypothetical protein
MSRKLINKSLSLIKTNEVQDTSNSLIATTTTGTPSAGTFYSSITGRANLPDLSADNKVRMGIERIAIQQMYQSQNEFGPNSESIWVTPNDNFGQIRLCGNWAFQNGTLGNVALGSNIGDFAEITFYGTGLNLLSIVNQGTSTVSCKVDGIQTSSNIYIGSQNTVIQSRNVSENIVNLAVSGLSLGVHTVTLTFTANNGNSFNIHGFEILNEGFKTTANTNTSTSLTNVANTAGLSIGLQIIGTGIPANTTITAISGSTITMSNAATATAAISVTFEGLSVITGGAYRAGLKMDPSALQQLLPYNSSFDLGTLGTKGGRVAVYQKADGTVGKAVNPTNATQLNLAAADHTNEEIVRTYFWREFGAGRSDDFSRMNPTAQAAAFTLDDGTTSLMVDNGSDPGNGYLIHQAPGNFYTIFFVGTGLDIITLPGSNPGGTVYIDGVAVSGTGDTGWGANKTTIKICSGLSYGAHSICFQRTTSFYMYVKQFIVYQPKTPAIPSGAIQLGSYNVMANYVTTSTVNNFLTMSAGILRKNNTREMVYIGSGWTASGATGSQESGFIVYTPTNGDYVQYTFYGTGFEARQCAGGPYNQQVTIDGATNLSVTNSSPVGGAGWTGSLTTSFYGADITSFTASTGVVVVNSTGSSGCAITVTGLALGLHTVRLTKSSGAGNMSSGIFDIITPIHSTQSNLYAEFQNALPVGSCAISDDRSFAYDTYVPKKAWSQAVAVTSSPTTSVNGTIPMTDMSVTIKTAGGALKLSGYVVIQSTASAGVSYFVGFMVDGAISNLVQGNDYALNGIQEHFITAIIPVAPGVHKVDFVWNSSGSAITAYGAFRNFTVEEK